jgi:hypothetical protein
VLLLLCLKQAGDKQKMENKIKEQIKKLIGFGNSIDEIKEETGYYLSDEEFEDFEREIEEAEMAVQN